MDLRRQFGDKAEAAASVYLQNKGYTIIEKNYRKPWGEIDIIAKKGSLMVFVEVKANAKTLDSAFNPEVRADHNKLRKVIRTATLYLGKRPGGLDNEWRIDIISVTMNETVARITHFKNVAESPF